MAISQAVANVFKQELLKGNHDFDGGGTYYIALYTYTAGGKVCGNPSVTGGQNSTTAFVDFDNVSFANASFTANGALIYRQDGSAPTNDAVVVLAFGGDFTASNGTFEIQFPASGGGSEIIRLG